MGRPLRDQSIDLDLGKADLVELGPGELRRQPAGRKIWSSSPVRLVALVFGRAHRRRARARSAGAGGGSHRHPQRAAAAAGRNLRRAAAAVALGLRLSVSRGRRTSRGRAHWLAARSAARTLSLAVDDPALRRIADRIALNARDAGLAVSVAPQNPDADVRLVEVRIASSDPARALAGLAAALGLARTAARAIRPKRSTPPSAPCSRAFA